MKFSSQALFAVLFVFAAVLSLNRSQAVTFLKAPTPNATVGRTQLNEVAWLQNYVDQGFLQYEVSMHQPLSNGAVNCNITNGAAAFTNLDCQRFSFLSAAYGVVLGPINATDGRDYIHHALAIMTYPIPFQSPNGSYTAGSCTPVNSCIGTDMTFAYSDFSHTIEMLNQSPFYVNSDTEDHSIVTGTIEPSLSKGLAWLNISGSGSALAYMQADNMATNRIVTHANGYYDTAEITQSINSSVAATGLSNGDYFVRQATGPNTYKPLPTPSYLCVPSNLCPWPSGSAFWEENEDSPGSKSGFDSGYGGVGVRQGDYFAFHGASDANVGTLSTELQAYSTWLYSRVLSTGVITEEGNYRTCGSPNPPATYKSNCPSTPANMAWEDVAWALYYEAPFAPDNAGKTCAEYIAAARAVEYYYMENSSYLGYPAQSASGYNIPAPTAAAPAACSQTYSALRQAFRRVGSRATAFADRWAPNGGGIRLGRGDSLAFAALDGGRSQSQHSVAVVYSLAGRTSEKVILRLNNAVLQLQLPPTGSYGAHRLYKTADAALLPFEEGRHNSLSITSFAQASPIDITSLTVRPNFAELKPR